MHACMHSFIDSSLLKCATSCKSHQSHSFKSPQTPRPRSPGQPLTSVDPERDMPFCFNALLRRVSALLDSRQDEESTRMASEKICSSSAMNHVRSTVGKECTSKKSQRITSHTFRHLQSPQVLLALSKGKIPQPPKSFLDWKYQSSTRFLSFLFTSPSGIPLSTEISSFPSQHLGPSKWRGWHQRFVATPSSIVVSRGPKRWDNDEPNSQPACFNGWHFKVQTH